MLSVFSRLFLLAVSVTPALAFCGSHTYLDPRPEGQARASPEFGYFGTQGPVLWTQLNPAKNKLCSTGANQSPINMVEGQFNLIPASDIELTIPDAPKGATFENIGTTVDVVMKDVGGTFILAGKNYTLDQFHFHHPSEHINNDVSMPMEMHMVFTTKANEMAVIGVYVDLVESRATPSNLLETIFSSIGKIANVGASTKTKPLVMSELVKLLKAGKFQRYTGSLTTPPCSEGIQWSVSTQKLLLSTATYQAARNVLGFNSRFPQNKIGEKNLLTIASTAPKVRAVEIPANVTAIHRRRLQRN